uniref:Uncharacterized protein n=1 Tax=Romanomermis culicivorax TaxID=13658 RepID=A0A915HK86_ROMCU
LSDYELGQVCDLTTVPSFEDQLPIPQNLIPFDALRALHETFCSKTCQNDAHCKNGGITLRKPGHCNQCICPQAKWCRSLIMQVKEGQSIKFRTGNQAGYSFPLPQDCTWLFKPKLLKFQIFS